ncbi:hypothetical protein [Luteimonas terrae]|uniref:Uncharacterized protein n=1 Tax=Luteimonas terrae TaxID=1530191 RepID=A0ABU1XYP4_9GAMM|nr:hypothetical protein [Luteimonas terrae]MDR7193894.1 hypothetical protein [Luteimonas terrae]
MTSSDRKNAPAARNAHALSLVARGRAHSLEARLSISTGGLLAVGALVSGILLGVTAIIVASTR